MDIVIPYGSVDIVAVELNGELGMNDQKQENVSQAVSRHGCAFSFFPTAVERASSKTKTR